LCMTQGPVKFIAFGSLLDTSFWDM
jgi:hypothetical protein